MSDNNRPPIARTHYFSGESLLTADFICEQQYNIDMLALLNSSLRTWGIASGLEVSWQVGSQSNQVTVSAGMAIDQLGRQIVLTAGQVVKLDGVPVGSTVYLTIRYHEAYADYSDESGVPGYKRIVQQPMIEYLRTLQEPGINILLAVVDVSSQGGIDTLTFKSGQYERRYVGSRLGVLELVTEGSGINKQAVSGGINESITESWLGIQLKALKESTASADYLDIQANRSQFDGMLTTRGNLGVGIDQPQANLQVESITSKGVGKLTTKGKLLKFLIPVYPPLQSGDVVIPELPVGAAMPTPRKATIKSVDTDTGQYQMEQAFDIDLILPTQFSYVRATLASFSAGEVGQLFRIDGDGTVGLGAQFGVQTGKAGPAALTISSDRSVGISFDTKMEPRATLDVNGGIFADSLTCMGIVQAKSFQGNGSMLQNLPILSYWTKQNVASSYSAIYYNLGNVGVQMTNPPASLSVGTGMSFIGAGSVSADKTDTSKLNGSQTAFKTQVSLGDSIVLGSIMQQWKQIKKITSDTQLELVDQFPTMLQHSAFQYVPAGSASIPGGAQLIPPPPAITQGTKPERGSAEKKDPITGPVLPPNPTPDAKPGKGTLSSSGVMISGIDTQFTKDLKQGDWLLIAEFKPDTTAGYQNQWPVQQVIDDTTLLLINKSGALIPANVSAYMVTPSLIGVFQSNAISASDPQPPPAMLLMSNGSGKATSKANTVAINLSLDEIDQDYALQVNGDVNFSGSSTFDKLIAKTLTVTEWAKITGSGDAGTVLMAGPSNDKPLLSVTATNVVIGASTGGSLLEVGGDMHATGNLIADSQLQGASAKVTGVVSGGSLQANAMNVTGVAVDEKGNVSMLATRTPITISSTSPSASGPANTDGFIVANIGTVDPNFQSDFVGMLTCQTTMSGSPTSVSYASASTTEITIESKKGHNTYYLPQYGTLCVPVRKNEIWSLVLTTETQWKPAPNVQAYWIALGPSNTPSTGVSSAMPPPTTAGFGDGPSAQLWQNIETLRQRTASGGGQSSSMAEAQRVIDQRVGDLTKILGDATKMTDDPTVRGDFIKQLQKIVCSAAPASAASDNRVDAQHITDLIDTFVRITGRQLTPEQRGLLDSGIRALVAINDNATSRNDVNLIRTNIGLFLQHLQQATDLTLDNSQLRLLTRALVRLVGNGTQDPIQVSADPPGRG